LEEGPMRRRDVASPEVAMCPSPKVRQYQLVVKILWWAEESNF